MRILFLDDSDERMGVFLTRAALHTVFTTTRSEDVIRTLQDEAYNFDLVFLDHDLGESNGTGMDVVNHLVAIPFLEVMEDMAASLEGRKARKPVYIIHSTNTPAGVEMTLKLQRAAFNAVFQPFAWETYPV
jgi:hypothetical protein